jgi:hypothetical protein
MSLGSVVLNLLATSTTLPFAFVLLLFFLLFFGMEGY